MERTVKCNFAWKIYFEFILRKDLIILKVPKINVGDGGDVMTRRGEHFPGLVKPPIQGSVCTSWGSYFQVIF